MEDSIIHFVVSDVNLGSDILLVDNVSGLDSEGDPKEDAIELHIGAGNKEMIVPNLSFRDMVLGKIKDGSLVMPRRNRKNVVRKDGGAYVVNNCLIPWAIIDLIFYMWKMETSMIKDNGKTGAGNSRPGMHRVGKALAVEFRKKGGSLIGSIALTKEVGLCSGIKVGLQCTNIQGLRELANSQEVEVVCVDIVILVPVTLNPSNNKVFWVLGKTGLTDKVGATDEVVC
ncbi:hypothetical protein V6N12_045621 [Hibiscus sabdariffa]|uniref:Uncharacterized protein n=1 Tax=Hibiscus sabdariffa TaxID=183260 RepID=A0ABR2G3A9_9ROSI